MIGNLFGLMVLLALVVLFGWLAKRAWRAQRWFVKFPGAILAGLLALVLAIGFIVASIGFAKTTLPPGNAASNLKVPATPEQLARGEKFALGCSGCHSSDGTLPLSGGKENFAEIPNGPTLGSIYPPNLTPAGELKDWTDGEIVRAIREGVHKSGRPLIVMPTQAFHSLSDNDVQAIVAYLRSQPATPNIPQSDAPANSPNLLGLIMLGAGMFETSAQPAITSPVADPPAGVNVQRGQYLATVMGCSDCHGKTLTGGEPGGFAPVGPNIVAATANWSDADFLTVFRSGKDPKDGRTLSENMPWKDYGKFSDDEFKSILMYLKTLPKESIKK